MEFPGASIDAIPLGACGKARLLKVMIAPSSTSKSVKF